MVAPGPGYYLLTAGGVIVSLAIIAATFPLGPHHRPGGRKKRVTGGRASALRTESEFKRHSLAAACPEAEEKEFDL